MISGNRSIATLMPSCPFVAVSISNVCAEGVCYIVAYVFVVFYDKEYGNIGVCYLFLNLLLFGEGETMYSIRILIICTNTETESASFSFFTFYADVSLM